MRKAFIIFCLLPCLLFSQHAFSADSVPSDVQMPGTQPREIGNLESPNKCDNCHGGYNSAVEPAHNWRGSMMSHAGRDPIFWATVAVAEQDFDGVGDLCIRCHSTSGWLAGRSTPTDGSGLAAGDSDGVDCDYCHKLTDPDDSGDPLVGVMTPPFIANDGTEGYYGSGMSSMWGEGDKLGPYNDAEARHQFMQSRFHRDRDFCGTCHDVSNPVTGNLAHNHGQALEESPVVANGELGGPVDGKAVFNNPPYAYGIVERTFSEYKSGMISEMQVDEYPDQDEDFPFGGVLEAVYQAATQGGTQSANYQNPDAIRYFSCQTCHMRPVNGKGANKRGVPTRSDLPLHDLTGGNYWMPSVIDYLNDRGKLRLGGDMTAGLISSMYDGASRALEQLRLAATLKVEPGENEVKVINHTGHKLISGYPEGRRMWLNIKWYDDIDRLTHEDGAYGDLEVTFRGQPLTVRTLLDLEGANTMIYQAHMGMTQEWARQLVDLEYDPELALKFDRLTGAVSYTLGELAAQDPGSNHETFHFALNNIVIGDNRIPPYRMRYDIAKQRNALPVPENQYNGGGAGSIYNHYDEVTLVPPGDAVYATIDLMYQPTSWEYIQFLALANNHSNAFLGEEGDIMLDAWLHTLMAEPIVMASAAWGTTVELCDVATPTLTETIADDKKVTVQWAALPDENIVSYGVYYDQAGKAQWVTDSGCTSEPCSYNDLDLTNGQEYCYKLTAKLESCESGFSNIQCATPQPPGHQQLAGVDSLETGKWVREGKGKNATTTWVLTTEFAAGDSIVFLGLVTDDTGAPFSGVNFDLEISGPESTFISSVASDSEGYAEATWVTQKPNKRGAGGTTQGAYTATVTGLSAGGYDWDGNSVHVDFSIGPP
jgi:hypothetical protein